MSKIILNGAKWYTYKQLCNLKKDHGIDLPATELCDKSYNNGRLVKRFNGGYGFNVVEKINQWTNQEAVTTH